MKTLPIQVRGLGRVSYPYKFKIFQRKIVQMGASQKLKDYMYHRDPEHFINNKKKMFCYLPLPAVSVEWFRRDLNEAKAVYIAVIKINVLLFTFVLVCFEYCYLPLSVSFLSRLEGIWMKRRRFTYLFMPFVIMTLRLRLKFRVTPWTITCSSGFITAAPRKERKETRGETYEKLSSGLWLQLSGPACVIPRVDMCEETRDDGRRPLTSISPPSANNTSSSLVRGNFKVVYWWVDLEFVFCLF